LAQVGCSGEATVAEPVLELSFEARVGDTPFSCAQPLWGLGTSAASAEALDLRLYVYEITLERVGGALVPFELVADGEWQSAQVALLDFENGSGRCADGTAQTNTTLRGHAPTRSQYVGMSFTVGVPPELDHLDLSSAEAPLDVPGMWRSWQGGYKYLRADFTTVENPGGYLFHLGAEGCAGSPSSGYACAQDNHAKITLAGDIDRPIILDLQQLLSGVDLARAPDGKNDLLPGCMSSASDPECAPLFEALGMPDGEQRVFSLP
jgi:uncharacterized repeat protein (TIGR04052 family)